jgi:Arc/MetJ family transcription regulator
MAQAISERLLQRALGPLDLSYAYQKIDAVSRQLGAEDRLRKQEAAKQYHEIQGDDDWLDWEEEHKKLLKNGE